MTRGVASQVYSAGRAQHGGGQAPGDFKLVEIAGVDLVQRCVAGAGQVVGIVAPFGIGRGRMAAAI